MLRIIVTQERPILNCEAVAVKCNMADSLLLLWCLWLVGVGYGLAFDLITAECVARTAKSQAIPTCTFRIFRWASSVNE